MNKTLEQLEKEAIAKMNERGTGRITNSTVLIELLTGNKIPRRTAPVKAASLFYAKYNDGAKPTSVEYMEKVSSIKNSLDTLVSHYNTGHIKNGSTMIKDNGTIIINVPKK